MNVSRVLASHSVRVNRTTGPLVMGRGDVVVCPAAELQSIDLRFDPPNSASFNVVFSAAPLPIPVGIPAIVVGTPGTQSMTEHETVQPMELELDEEVKAYLTPIVGEKSAIKYAVMCHKEALDLELLSTLDSATMKSLGFAFGHAMKIERSRGAVVVPVVVPVPATEPVVVVEAAAPMEIEDDEIEIVVAPPSPPPPPPPPPPDCCLCDAIASVSCSACPDDHHEFCFRCYFLVDEHKQLSEVHSPVTEDPELNKLQRLEVEREQNESHEAFLGELREVVSLLKSEVLSKPVASNDRKEYVTRDLEKISSQMQSLPRSVIVVVGDTGSGKSTLLNSLLGESSILPTNGWRACTASLIEMSYYEAPEGEPAYRGEIEFLSPAEWRHELDLLESDLESVNNPGQIVRRTDPESMAGVALDRIKTVYGAARVRDLQTMDDFQRLKRLQTRVTRALGKVRHVTGIDATEFRLAIEEYADSANAASNEAFWPIVKQIRIMGPWSMLRSGSIVVDAPGINDDNSARDGVVKGYLQNASSIMICSNITRAVNDRTAKDMLGESFRRQLLMDGAMSDIIFVTTKSDTLSRSELRRNLNLPKEATTRECALARNKFARQRIKADFQNGLQEMAYAAAGDDEAAAEAAFEKLNRFNLPVFCTSSYEFQKLSLVNLDDGEATVFRTVEETEIPALRHSIYILSMKKRYAFFAKLNKDLQLVLESTNNLLTTSSLNADNAGALKTGNIFST